MSDTKVEPEPEVEHEYCGECGDFIRHEFKCEPGCSENGKDITQRKKMVVAIYKLDRMENRNPKPSKPTPPSLDIDYSKGAKSEGGIGVTGWD